MSTPAPVLALLGGTFDPIHYGHLRAAWEAAEQLDAQVCLMPANVPPHRPQPRLSAEQRVQLLELALAGQQRLALDTRELRRDGPSYTVDTLRELREEIGAARPLVLLLGTDAFAGLPSWSRWLQLFELAHIGVMTRPGAAPALSPELHAQFLARACAVDGDWRGQGAGRILSLDITDLDISATGIRNLLARGQEPRFLLPEAVLAQIRQRGWYR
ncbi:nicotinate-nucleotide adenylyltransferase [Tahibacter aquaticus]|uniref:Probable nicotinate-nucleotide adenylyltransferase n=1 Tax=Tahibacter aquaticus TaxID=520092 RepID=A0A4R6YRZ7_9GAMM|nr:nicotinate-nucleotide adenylyltransferase [Tahibacter aquaticus]TDR40844.1 nicotinate-nucleotide adenylyltransferase [Tahibacter aquaticus]